MAEENMPPRRRKAEPSRESGPVPGAGAGSRSRFSSGHCVYADMVKTRQIRRGDECPTVRRKCRHGSVSARRILEGTGMKLAIRTGAGLRWKLLEVDAADRPQGGGALAVSAGISSKTGSLDILEEPCRPHLNSGIRHLGQILHRHGERRNLGRG